MQIIIDISEKDYEVMKASVNKSASDYRILEGTPLSENPTNGDVIKAMFNVEIVDDFYQSVGIKLNDSNYIQFNKDWWNAPYKGVSKW